MIFKNFKIIIINDSFNFKPKTIFDDYYFKFSYFNKITIRD